MSAVSSRSASLAGTGLLCVGLFVQAAPVGNLCLTRSLGAGNLELNQRWPLSLRVSFVLLWAFLINCTLDLSVSSVQSETCGLDNRSHGQERAGIAGCESGSLAGCIRDLENVLPATRNLRNGVIYFHTRIFHHGISSVVVRNQKSLRIW